MHSHCFAQYSHYNYTCPICVKSIGDMTVYFSMIESLVSRPNDLPPEYAKRTQVQRFPFLVAVFQIIHR